MKVLKGDAWRYHPDHEPIMIYAHEFDEYEAKGWVDTPAKLGVNIKAPVEPVAPEVKKRKGGKAKRNQRKQAK